MDQTLLSKVLTHQLQGEYHSPRELMYATDPGFFLSPHDYGAYLDYVDELVGRDAASFDLPLKSFNSKHVFCLSGAELNSLHNSYLNLLKESSEEGKTYVFDAFADEITKSRIYSEIEGTLNVENVPTTRKRLKELLEKNKKPESKNDIIIKNMSEGIHFVSSLPSFDKENLLRLYNILSHDSLDEDDKLKPGWFYRDDEVEVDDYPGCPFEKVSECMDSLFAYANEVISHGSPLQKLYLPHICHYYLVYIHPYFDFNGRTARMVSLWVNLLAKENTMPPLISEAINQNKAEYYRALRDARNARNDIAYFLLYIFKTAIKYILCYKDLAIIDQMVKNQNDVLSDTELNYVKRMLVSYQGKFSYRDFIKNCQIEISKQGAFKILNHFVDLQILIVVNTHSKTKLFDFNPKVLKYTRMQ
ncbi:MAG: Fic family protein [Bacilli bacterium]|nr:Fic family protein [Bacilli bacterium]